MLQLDKKNGRSALKGVTIIELGIVMIIAGLALVMTVQLYTNYVQSRFLIETQEKINEIDNAISVFFSLNQRYPCPANPRLPLADANAGLEICGSGGGVVSTTGRDADGNGTPDNVLIGAVPFRTLQRGLEQLICYSTTDRPGQGITRGQVVPCNAADPDQVNPSDVSIDAMNINKITDSWGRQMTYAVTASQTNTSTYVASRGAIAVETELGESLVRPAGSARYVVLSHGVNGNGAFDRQGRLFANCDTSRRDGENCDNNDARFVSSLMWLNRDLPTYYDDMIKFNAFSTAELWRSSAPGQIFNANVAGNVGIGTQNPTERLHVEGAIRSDEARAAQICDTGNNCFNPASLSGSDPCMKCPKDKCPGVPDDPKPTAGKMSVMVGVAKSRAFCTIVDLPTTKLFAGKSCPPGKLMTGVKFNSASNSADIICSSP